MANGIGIGSSRLRVVKRNVVIVALVVSSVSPEQEYSKYLVFVYESVQYDLKDQGMMYDK